MYTHFNWPYKCLRIVSEKTKNVNNAVEIIIIIYQYYK